MDIFYNFIIKVKQYFTGFFINNQNSVLNNSELNIIINNKNLNDEYISLNIDNMYIELYAINNSFTKDTPIITIIKFLEKEIKSYNLGFELKPHALNHTNLLKHIMIQTLKDQFVTLNRLKDSCNLLLLR